jgi:hypothetical protein
MCRSNFLSLGCVRRVGTEVLGMEISCDASS